MCKLTKATLLRQTTEVANQSRRKREKREMSSLNPLVAPTETLEIENGLSLIPRVKLHLTIYRSDKSVKPIDEWKLKRSLIDYLSTSNSLSIPEDDLEIRGFKDLKKRKREEPVASGSLCIRDLGFLVKNKRKDENLSEEGENREKGIRDLEKKFLEWREKFLERLDGIELSIEGAKFRLDAVLPACDDFEGQKKNWEEFYALVSRGYSSRSGRQPDTLVVRGLPSRWFAEPRVSSKPSMLVTHTIFSGFGKIRNLNVAADDDLGKSVEEGSEEIVSGLHCKVVVQFEKHDGFLNALKQLCGRSMQKQGSRLRADYEATWDRDDFFRNSQQGKGRNQIQERSRPEAAVGGHYKNQPPRYQSYVARSGNSAAYAKRFKE